MRVRKTLQAVIAFLLTAAVAASAPSRAAAGPANLVDISNAVGFRLFESALQGTRSAGAVGISPPEYTLMLLASLREFASFPFGPGYRRGEHEVFAVFGPASVPDDEVRAFEKSLGVSCRFWAPASLDAPSPQICRHASALPSATAINRWTSVETSGVLSSGIDAPFELDSNVKTVITFATKHHVPVGVGSAMFPSQLSERPVNYLSQSREQGATVALLQSDGVRGMRETMADGSFLYIFTSDTPPRLRAFGSALQSWGDIDRGFSQQTARIYAPLLVDSVAYLWKLPEQQQMLVAFGGGAAFGITQRSRITLTSSGLDYALESTMSGFDPVCCSDFLLPAGATPLRRFGLDVPLLLVLKNRQSLIVLFAYAGDTT